MERRHALAVLTVVSIVILACCLLGGAAGELVFAGVAVAFAPILIMVGVADRAGRLGGVAWLALALLLMLEACVAGMLAFRGAVETGPWLLGLPAAAAFQIFGLLLAPQVLIALGYALTFDNFTVSGDDLAALRELARPEAGEQAGTESADEEAGG